MDIIVSLILQALTAQEMELIINAPINGKKRIVAQITSNKAFFLGERL
ncbi:hypothetical protein ES705_09546 [subsurface metagenome]